MPADPLIVFLTLEQVLVIHDNQIERYGGSHGVANFPLLESAIMRPQTTFGGKDLYSTLFDKAAALVHSLVMNHVFVDGNKRTAAVSGVLFLELNGYRLEVSQRELVEAILSVRDKRWDIKRLSSWFRERSRRIKS
jgi:death-on-curing protein